MASKEKRTIVFYTPKQEKQLAEIKANFKGKERTAVVNEWALANNRNPKSVNSKIYNMKKPHKTMRNLTPVSTTMFPATPGKILDFEISSIEINGNRLRIHYR